eukprot:6203753-Pleurochrysis_carterae.AAC.1
MTATCPTGSPYRADPDARNALNAQQSDERLECALNSHALDGAQHAGGICIGQRKHAPCRALVVRAQQSVQRRSELHSVHHQNSRGQSHATPVSRPAARSLSSAAAQPHPARSPRPHIVPACKTGRHRQQEPTWAHYRRYCDRDFPGA